jgi:endonuclease/exonuclease/phosphatase family metal-dependent hydrolase
MKKTIYLLCSLALFAACCNVPGAPETKNKKNIRLVSYNVGAFHKSGHSTISMIADMLDEMQADVVGIQEVDSCTTRTGKVDQLDSLCTYLGGWCGKYGDAMPYKGGKYGVSVLAKPEYKVLATDVLHLPKGTGNEPRAVAVVEYEDFVFASTHIDFGEANQMMQLQLVCQYFDSLAYQKPVFLVGDFNAYPDSKAISYMQESWTLISVPDNSFPSHAPDRCIDFVFARNAASVKVVGGKVCTVFEQGDVAVASDHLPIYVDIQIEK